MNIELYKACSKIFIALKSQLWIHSTLFYNRIMVETFIFVSLYICRIPLIPYWHFLCILFQVRCIHVIKSNKYYNIDILNPFPKEFDIIALVFLVISHSDSISFLPWSRYKRSIVYLSLEKVNLSKNFKYLKIADGIIGLRYIGTFLGQM